MESISLRTILLLSNPAWLDSVNAWLAPLSSLATIIVGVMAIYGIKQISIAKAALRQTADNAKQEAKRESIKEASRLCEMFEKEIIPTFGIVAKRNKKNYDYLRKIKVTSFDPPQYDATEAPDWRTHAGEAEENIVKALNKLEAFSIPFIAGIADDKVAFLPASQTFIKQASIFLPVLLEYNRKYRHFVNTLSLLQKWDKDNKALSLSIMKGINEKRNEQIDRDLQSLR